MSHPAVSIVVLPRMGDGAAALTEARRQTGVELCDAVVAPDAEAGWRAASGEWVAFLQEGDRWAPERLAVTIGRADAVGAAWAYSSRLDVDGRGRVRNVSLAPAPDAALVGRLRGANVVGGLSCAVVRRDALERVGGLDAGLRIHAAWDLWLRLGEHGAPAAEPEPLVAELAFDPRVPAMADPERALAEAERLSAEGRVNPRGSPQALWMAGDLVQAGRSRAGARIAMRSGVAHRRPQDILRGLLLLRAEPDAAPVDFEPPRWLAAAP